jgi:hypothetical protein
MGTPLDMRPEIRARWTAALRSGEYEQGRQCLRSDDEFCCLGVLCDLAAKDGVITPVEQTDTWIYDGYTDFLPEAVRDWAGIEHGNPLVFTGGVPGTAGLITLNDDYRWDFDRIADAIDGVQP